MPVFEYVVVRHPDKLARKTDIGAREHIVGPPTESAVQTIIADDAEEVKRIAIANVVDARSPGRAINLRTLEVLVRPFA